MPSPAQQPRAPLLWLLVPLLAGLTAARQWPPPDFGLPALAVTAVAAGMAATWCGTRPGNLAAVGWGAGLAAAGALGGFVYFHARLPQWHAAAEAIPREVTVTVQIRQTFPAAPASRNLSGWGEIAAPNGVDPRLAGHRVYYSAIRRISLTPVRSGAYVMRGVIEPVRPDPGSAGFDDYLGNLGVREKLGRAQILREAAAPGRFSHFCAAARRRLEEILRQGIAAHPAPASLYVAMLLGGKAAMSADQQNAFIRSGTFHVFSVSGLHIGVIAVALQAALRLLRMPRRPAFALGLLVLWLYVEITGGNSPAERALLMIAFFQAARVFRLPGNALAALTASALVTLLLDPLQLFTAGFQMSYSVVTALLLMAVPLAEKWLAAWRPFALLAKTEWRWMHRAIDFGGRKVVSAAAACWVAFLASIPSAIGYFQLLSPGSLVANLVIIPASSCAITLGFGSLVTGLVGLQPLSAGLNCAAVVIISGMDWLLEKTTDWPGVYFPAHFIAPWIAPTAVGLLTAVILAGAAGGWARRFGGFWPPAVFVALVLIFATRFP